MKRILGLAVLLFMAPMAAAQDMPLSMFLISGEKWKKAEVAPPELPALPKIAEDAPRPAGAMANVFANTRDRGTVYVGFDRAAAVWAFKPGQDGSLTAGAPYAPLRTEKGYNKNKDAQLKRKNEPPTLAVTGLVVDSRGCIFAATAIGLHIYDPTGRLCGVIDLPAGQPGILWWTSDKRDQLAIKIADATFTRKLSTK